MMMVYFTIDDDNISWDLCIGIPNFQMFIHATRQEHSCIQGIPLNTLHAVLMAVTITLPVNFPHIFTSKLQISALIQNIMNVNASISTTGE